MKKKIIPVIFTALALLICLVPFVCMSFAESDEVIGNESKVSLPSITKKDGSFNTEILEGLGDYFDTHYAFRPWLLTADAKIQNGLFGVSNTDTVITGNNGWLYYASTLNDYLGENTLTERGMFNLAHNLALIQSYAVENGAKFAVMIAPNKNSLYGENMPYYYGVSASDSRNRDSFKEAFDEAGVNYVDLFELFESQNEVLYLKLDSHWNNKGALLVYNKVLDELGAEHDDYADVEVTQSLSYDGDLAAMIYPAGTESELNYDYDYDKKWEYVTGSAVEDSRIETSDESESGTLLMYRDSFGNSLIPFMANAFKTSCFSKGVPYSLESDMATYSPDYVIVEKVERNVSEFVKTPAIISAPEAEINADNATLFNGSDSLISIGNNSYNMSYITISGQIPESIAENDSTIYVKITCSDGTEKTYEAYNISDSNGDNGFELYFEKTAAQGWGNSVNAEVYVKSGENMYVSQEITLTIPA